MKHPQLIIITLFFWNCYCSHTGDNMFGFAQVQLFSISNNNTSFVPRVLIISYNFSVGRSLKKILLLRGWCGEISSLARISSSHPCSDTGQSPAHDCRRSVHKTEGEKWTWNVNACCHVARRESVSAQPRVRISFWIKHGAWINHMERIWQHVLNVPHHSAEDFQYNCKTVCIIWMFSPMTLGAYYIFGA